MYHINIRHYSVLLNLQKYRQVGNYAISFWHPNAQKLLDSGGLRPLPNRPGLWTPLWGRCPRPHIRFCIMGVVQNSAQTAQNSTKVAQNSCCFRLVKNSWEITETDKNATMYTWSTSLSQVTGSFIWLFQTSTEDISILCLGLLGRIVLL